MARFPPYPSDNAAWIAKQALDMGLMGIVFNTVNTKEEAIAYAERSGIAYRVAEPTPRRPVRKSYADNFRFGRKGSWTH